MIRWIVGVFGTRSGHWLTGPFTAILEPWQVRTSLLAAAARDRRTTRP